jgi:hypothetical protein
MINRAIWFIWSTIGIDMRLMCLSICPTQTNIQKSNRCTQCKIIALQYREKCTIWKLGKNKFI